MTDDIKCKRIIDGKTYNTETSTLLSKATHDTYDGYLFKTRHGAYFEYVDLWNVPEEKLTPFTPEQAQKWMEENCSAEVIEAEFGKMPEAGDPEARFTVRMPETLRKRIASIAEGKGQSLNAWTVRAIEQAAANVGTTATTVSGSQTKRGTK